jgi:hypothetical protein
MMFVGITKQNGIYAIVGREELQAESFDVDYYDNILNLPSDLCFISISDPHKDFIKTNGYFKDELFLKFYDVEEPIGNYVPITDEQAKYIYDFIIKNKDSMFLINCEAGVSRSAGVGLAIEYITRDIFIFEKWEHFPSKVLSHYRYEPNMTVFNKIIKFDGGTK